MLKETNLSQAIITTRTFSCRREQLFTAWSNPQLLARWWGPNGFTSTIHVFEFAEGGTWKLTMHGPDGTNYENENRFTEIIVPERIVFTHLESIHTFTATALFEDRGESSRLTFIMVFDLLSEYEKLKDFIAAANEENFDRLEKVVHHQK